MQLDYLDIDMELLPVGMERRIMNQSTWDFKNRTALLTIEFHFHARPDPLLPSSTPASPPFKLLTHRNALSRALLPLLHAHLSERTKSKTHKDKDKDAPPAWLAALVFPDPDEPDAFAPPTCVMRTSFDPLAPVRPCAAGARPGSIRSAAYHRLDVHAPLGEALRHRTFVEYPTIEVWAADAFCGTLVDDSGALVREGAPLASPVRKRRKLSAAQSRKAMVGLLGVYGSDGEEGGEGDEAGAEEAEERNVLQLLDGYPGSDEEEEDGPDGGDEYDDGLGDEDAEGETDEEYEDDARHLAALLETLRESGALRGDSLAHEDEDEQVDWGEYAQEDGVD